MDGLALLVFAIVLCYGMATNVCSEAGGSCVEVASPPLCPNVRLQGTPARAFGDEAGCDSNNYPCRYKSPSPPTPCIGRTDWPNLTFVLTHLDDATFRVTLSWPDLSNVTCLQGFYVTMTSFPVVQSSKVKDLSECNCLLLNKTAQNYTFEGAYQKDKVVLQTSYLKLTLLPDEDGPSLSFENPKQCHNVYMGPDRCAVCGQQYPQYLALTSVNINTHWTENCSISAIVSWQLASAYYPKIPSSIKTYLYLMFGTSALRMVEVSDKLNTALLLTTSGQMQLQVLDCACSKRTSTWYQVTLPAGPCPAMPTPVPTRTAFDLSTTPPTMPFTTPPTTPPITPPTTPPITPPTMPSSAPSTHSASPS